LLQCFLRCSFYMYWWLCRSLFPFYVFFWNLPSLRTMISLTFSMTCSFVLSVYYCRCFKEKKKKKTTSGLWPWHGWWAFKLTREHFLNWANSRKKHKTETSYDIITNTYKKNTLKNIATNETAIYWKTHSMYELV
jgi:hypothetical protein